MTQPSGEFPNMFGEKVQRTMRLLATSTRTHRNQVRVLFYGQSITEQDWTREVAADLLRRFPNADIVIQNRAIGGFSANLLKRVVDSDVYSFYPDLVIFHDYGPEEDYEAIVRGIRANTTAEMILQSDHIALNSNGDWHDQHSFHWLPALAERYGCEMAEIRAPWRRYLTDNGLGPADLLRDNVHLNDAGCRVLANLILRHLVYLPLKNPTDPPETVLDLPLSATDGWSGDTLIVPFVGNRIDVLAEPTLALPSHASVTIDGKSPSELPELYVTSRPSATPGVGWPAILQVGRLDSAQPLEEDWTLTITRMNDAADDFAFTVHGSHTGADGSGVNTERFVSNSGRVVLEPIDWHFQRSRDYTKIVPPVGYSVHWQVTCQGMNVYTTPRNLDPSRECATTLVQGLPNGPHTLTLKHHGGAVPSLRGFRIYRPPLT